MPVAGTAKDHQVSFLFELLIDAMKSTEVMSISGLESELAVIEHYEGGATIPVIIPGRCKVKKITITRSQTGDLDWWTWHSMLVQQTAAGVGADASGLPRDVVARNGDIVTKGPNGAVMLRWSFAGALPTKYSTSKWDNGTDEVMTESLELTFTYFDRTL